MLTISDAWLHDANLDESELRLELALALLERKRISFEQARKLAQLDVIEFLKHVSQRHIVLEYDVPEWQHDLEALRRLGQL